MTVVVTRENTDESAVHKFLAEASELRLPPGVWPRLLQTTLGNGMPFVGFKKKLNRDGDIEYVRYLQECGCVELVVFND